MKKPLVIFVVGPTATGKSAFAVEAAQEFDGEIINTDSVQVYQSVDIGTAKPTPSDFKRVPHHLYSYVPEGETSTVGEFRREALAIIEQGPQRGTEKFFAVGGSGFYVQALEKGMYPVPKIPDAVRESIANEHAKSGLGALYQELHKRDPEYAKDISENDTYRIMRSLEIARHLQGQSSKPTNDNTWSGIRRKFEAEIEKTRSFDVLKIGILQPRAKIRKNVELRTAEMLKNGFIEEVKLLRDKGLSKWAPMLSVGYKEVQQFLDGELAKKDLAEKIVTSTMQLVKRQTTWFRRDKDIQWFDANEGWAKPLAFIQAQVDKRG
jgi:tRNA dimethylallyltransferase